MIGIKFGSFLTLLILGFIASLVMHSMIRYRTLESYDGFVAEWMAAWIGAWLGGPVLGHWWLQIQDIYIIPALAGAFVGAFSIAFWVKAIASTNGTLNTAKAATAVVPTEMLKETLRRAG